MASKVWAGGKKKKKKIIEESHPGLILGRSIDRGWTSKEEE